MLLRITTLPKVPAGFWLLPDCGEEGGNKPQHSQWLEFLHQHQHYYQQTASRQGFLLILLKFRKNEMLEKVWAAYIFGFRKNLDLKCSYLDKNRIKVIACCHLCNLCVQDSESSLSEDTGLGSDESSSCKCPLHQAKETFQ